MNMQTLAPLTPKLLPGWVSPSMAIFVLTSGNCEVKTIVLPVAVRSGKLNLIKSVVALPFAAASVNASRSVPGPASALLVTTKTAGNTLKLKQHNKIKSKNILRNIA